jgi:hypothetical protein
MRSMAKYMTASQTGEELNLEHKEVIRRIRRGEIVARKLGWNWIVGVDEVEAVKNKPWYKKLMALRAQRQAQAS